MSTDLDHKFRTGDLREGKLLLSYYHLQLRTSPNCGEAFTVAFSTAAWGPGSEGARVMRSAFSV